MPTEWPNDEWPFKNHFWVIDANHNVRPVTNMVEWTIAYEDVTRLLARTGNDKIWVSTVFLAINHNFGFEEEKRPILFETMIFGGEFDGFQSRYCTYEEAMEGHKEAVERAFGHVAGVGSKIEEA